MTTNPRKLPMARRAVLIGLLALLAAASLACKAAQGQWRVDTPPAEATLAWEIEATSPVGAPSTEAPEPGALAPTASAPAPALSDDPAAAAATEAPAPQAPFTPNPEATARQLQVFDEFWNVVNENYLYADFNGLDWDAARQESTAKIEAGISDDDFYAEIYRLVVALGDEHSAYFDPEAAALEDAEFAGEYNYTGIGIMTSLRQEKRTLVVLLVFPDSPAERAGILMHDSIISVNGEPIVDDGGMRQNLLRGPEGTDIEVEVRSPGQASRFLTIKRARVTSQLPVPHEVLKTPSGKRIGYIFIPTFNDQTIDDSVGQALEDLTADGPLDGLILDNRENGGGASTVLFNTLGYFTEGPIGYFVEQRDENQLTVEANDINGSQEMPLVVLVGPGTASFGEVFAGALRDLGRAYIIGETTLGNVEILSIFDFSDGSRAWIATTTFRPLNDPQADWEQSGIVPDETAPYIWDEVTLTTDPGVLAALAYFDQP